MDKYSEMSPGLRKAAIVILQRAAEEFSNHGCNDFDLCAEAGLTKDEALDVLKQIRWWSGDKNMPEPERGDTVATDWCILSMLAAVLAHE